MKKLLKILGISVLVLLALLLSLPLLVESRIEGIVRTEADKRLTARLDFDKLDLSLLRHFPHASVDLKGLTLVGTGDFASDTIVAARRISVVVNLLSLVGPEGFEVTKVVLTDPAISARKLADGRVNWQVMQPAQTPLASEPSEADGASEPSAFRLSVRDVRIDGARIRYRDDQAGMCFATEPLALRLRGDLSASQADLRLRLDAREVTYAAGGTEWLKRAAVRAEVEASADFAARRFDLANNRLIINDMDVSLDGWVAQADDGLGMDLRVEAPKVGFRDLLSLVPSLYTRNFRELRATGELSLAAWARGMLRDDRLPAFEVRLGVSDGTVRYASLPGVIERINLKAAVTNPGGTMDATELDVEQFSLALGGNDLRASLHAAQPVSDLRLRAELDGRIDLKALSDAYPLGEGTRLQGLITANVRGEGRMSDLRQKRYRAMQASGVFTVENLELVLPDFPRVRIDRASAGVSPEAITLGELTARIGRSDLAARGQLTDYLGYLLGEGDLSGKLYLRGQLLDLNELLSGASEPEASTDAVSGDGSQTEAKPLLVPQHMRLTLDVALDKVLFGRMQIDGLAGALSMRSGTLSLDGLDMGLFGGRVTASGRYATAVDPQHPSLMLDLAVRQASFARTFDELETAQQLVPLFAKTGGDYSLTFKMNTRLLPSMAPDLPTLGAQGELRSQHIRLQNIAALDALAKVLHDDGLRTIEARDVRIRFKVTDGRITTEPFDLHMGKGTINLSGTTGLDQTIDYTARVTLPAGAGAAPGTFNVRIGGTFSSPEITLGIKEAAQEAVRNVVEQQVEQLTGGRSVEEVLDEAFEKQAAALREQARRAGEKLVEAARSQRSQLIDKAKNPITKVAAEKAGDALVKEAEKQAANLAAEAEKQIEALRAKRPAEPEQAASM